ncbi:hypothetical protein DV736_g2295, partial [Chaetothyriales sp. CBS 134916]
MMPFAPSCHALARGGSAKLGQLNPAELIQFRKLYLEKRYKQCITACAERLEEQLHPVHKAFLLFQQAVSYEAMGLAAHKYSRNRIPFFESAEEKLTSILKLLEQSTEGFLNNGDVPSALLPGDAIHRTPTPLMEAPSSDVFTDSSSVYSPHSDQTLDLRKCSARPNLFARLGCIPRTVTFPDVDKQDQDFSSDPDTHANDESDAEDRQHVSRLTASLSSTHILADDLVPQPLFRSRAKKAATIPSPRRSGITDAETVSTPQPRPLPSLLDHTCQTPNARGLLPSPLQHTPLSCYTDASIPSSAASTIKPDFFATPITPRFALIHSIFSHPQPHPHPVSLFDNHPSSLPSHDLARYNTALITFIATVHTALSMTRSTITSTQELQDEHAAAKRRAFIASSTDAGKRMASYWLLDTSITPTMKGRTRERGARKEVYNRGDEEDETAKKKKQERIEKLRAAEWRVNKEKFGWKGNAYYDTLIREVDIEMRLGVGCMGVKQ